MTILASPSCLSVSRVCPTLRCALSSGNTSVEPDCRFCRESRPGPGESQASPSAGPGTSSHHLAWKRGLPRKLASTAACLGSASCNATQVAHRSAICFASTTLRKSGSSITECQKNSDVGQTPSADTASWGASAGSAAKGRWPRQGASRCRRARASKRAPPSCLVSSVCRHRLPASWPGEHPL